MMTVYDIYNIIIYIILEFDNADALLVSEVKMLLEHRKAQHESQDDDQDLSEVPKIPVISADYHMISLPVRYSLRLWIIVKHSVNTIAVKQ